MLPNKFASMGGGGGGGSVSFSSLTGAPTDNVALAASLAAKASLNGATFTNGTLTVSAPVLKVEQTWNNVAVAFRGMVIECRRTLADDLSADLEIKNHEYPGYGSLLFRARTSYLPFGATQPIPSIQAGDSGQIVNIGHTNGWTIFNASSEGNSSAALRYDQFNFRRDLKIGWSSAKPGDAFLDAVSGNMDTCLMRGGAAATVQMGENHATTPTNQVLKAHNVTTGTGASLTIRPGEGSIGNGGLYLGTTGDAVGFHGSASYQATRIGAAAVHVVGSGTAVTEDSEFDGYTIGQVVQSLINKGVLAA